MPRYTVLLPTEDETTVRGRKILKDQLTLTVCANADGLHKIPLLLIGKPKVPGCVVGLE